MRRTILLAAALAALALPAHAGSVTLTYSGVLGGQPVTLSAPATISDADAATLIGWCMATHSGSEGADTPGGCFQVLANGIAAETIDKVLQWQRAQAAAAAAATVAPIQLVPSP